jgi:hypothetical protein
LAAQARNLSLDFAFLFGGLFYFATGLVIPLVLPAVQLHEAVSW